MRGAQPEALRSRAPLLSVQHLSRRRAVRDGCTVRADVVHAEYGSHVTGDLGLSDVAGRHCT